MSPPPAPSPSPRAPRSRRLPIRWVRLAPLLLLALAAAASVQLTLVGGGQWATRSVGRAAPAPRVKAAPVREGSGAPRPVAPVSSATSSPASRRPEPSAAAASAAPLRVAAEALTREPLAPALAAAARVGLHLPGVDLDRLAAASAGSETEAAPALPASALRRVLLEALARTREPEEALALGRGLEALPSEAGAAGELADALTRARAPEARIALLRAAGVLAPAAAAPLLERQALADPDPAVRAEARALLAALDPQEAPGPRLLEAWLRGELVGARAERLLARLARQPEGRVALERTLRSAPPGVALGPLARALGAGPAGPERLLELALGAAPAQACAASEALGRTASGAPLLRRVLAEAAAAPARLAALAALARQGALGEAELTALAAGSPLPEVRAAAARLLAREAQERRAAQASPGDAEEDTPEAGEPSEPTRFATPTASRAQ